MDLCKSPFCSNSLHQRFTVRETGGYSPGHIPVFPAPRLHTTKKIRIAGLCQTEAPGIQGYVKYKQQVKQQKEKGKIFFTCHIFP